MTVSELRTNAALEDIVAEDPYDEGRWSVLEDWLIEQDDPRAAILASRNPERARQQLYPVLFGPKHEPIAARLYTLAWRGGFLRECQFAAAGIAHFEEFVATPAVGLLRALSLSLFPDALRQATSRLAQAPFARSLRSLTLSMPSYTSHEVVRIEARPLSTLRLDRLALRGVFVDQPPLLPSVTTLVLAATAYDVEGLAPFVCSRQWLDLQELEIDMANLGTGTLLFEDLTPLFKENLAPQLSRLVLRSASEHALHAAVIAVKQTPLADRLHIERT
jgi:hypothetical protein